jgi:hypothetical protein
MKNLGTQKKMRSCVGPRGLFVSFKSKSIDGSGRANDGINKRRYEDKNENYV